MKMRLHYAILVLFVIILCSCTKEPLDDANTISVEAVNVTAAESELLTIVNDHRNTLGQNSLDFSEVAYEYANLHTDYMISVGAINHNNFDSRASKIIAEVNAKLVAENVAKDYSSALEAFESWLNSADHRKTMEGDFTHTAVSVKKNSEGKLYFTQLFYR
ncbi:uncharacterized protein YkwD [Saonia flava]|uniref:Uncharacterized protein YkwD n=1 Tax=Saonia flava TaxID=523696 RepID=A0A846QT98_9FLAO|nr:CAP domain-containing protein [Saonia flava]NJB71278.1 uncharacterized protein YkwD [Saonia flava]